MGYPVNCDNWKNIGAFNTDLATGETVTWSKILGEMDWTYSTKGLPLTLFLSLFNEVFSITMILLSSGPISLWQEQSLRSTLSRKSHLPSPL